MLVGVVLLATVAGCGGGGEAADTGAPTQARPAPASPDPVRRRPETVTPSHCPPSLPGCRRTEGRIVYVERVDPDGDGDAHFVVADPQGITLPGLTAIDVRKDLRPHPLPRPGDRLSAAGQVQTGSYGQSQIHAIELHVSFRGSSPAK